MHMWFGKQEQENEWNVVEFKEVGKYDEALKMIINFYIVKNLSKKSSPS
jgi:uncharacterized membrane protein YoaT (DUF817 family)